MKDFFKKHSKIRIVALVFAAVMIAEPTIGTARVMAIPDLYFYSSNDILFYDPDASCGVSKDGMTGTVALRGNTIQEKVWNFLRDKGLSNEQTAGVMGNIQAESAFNPDAIEKGNGIGYGIVQWSYNRRAALEAAAVKKEVPASDLGFQLEYLYQELNARPIEFSRWRQFNNEWEMMRGQTTVEQATIAFHHQFERSHLSTGNHPETPGGRADQLVIQERVRKEPGPNSNDFFEQFSGLTPGGGGSVGGECEAAPTGNLEATTLAYAWDKYTPPDYTERKAEYKTAVEKAQSQGLYVGGGPYPGVDCGGFVTLLMRDSGFEPGYNNNGRGGNTGPQEAWVKSNWTTLGIGSEMKVGGDPSDEKVLRPGDVAFSPGHTFAYVGMIPGFGEGDPAFKGVASASYLSWRAPMVGHENMLDGNVTWYRKK